MDSTIWAAIIAGVFAILTVIVTYWLTSRSSRKNDPLKSVEGYIFEPVLNQEVEKEIKCRGEVKNIRQDVYLRLAVEVGDMVWPKEGAVNVDDDGKWSATIVEDGTPERFSIVLYAMNIEGDRKVNEWLNDKDYSGLRRIYGARRIAKVGGLRLAKE